MDLKNPIIVFKVFQILVNVLKTGVLSAIRKKTILKLYFLILNTILYFLMLMNTWQLDKFKGAPFKYDNIIFKFPPKNSRNQALLIPNLKIFIFCIKLCNQTNSRTLCSNNDSSFSKLLHKTPKCLIILGIFGPKIIIFTSALSFGLKLNFFGVLHKFFYI